MGLRHVDPPPPPAQPDPSRPWPRRAPAPTTPPRPPLPSPPAGATLHPAPTPAADPVPERLLDERIVQLGRELDEAAAERVIGRLLLLGAVAPQREVTLVIGTLHGSAAAGLALYDTLRTLPGGVATRAVGLVGTVGALLLAAGTPGRRLVLPHTLILLRQPAAGDPGADPAVRTGLAGRLREQVAALLAAHTGRQPAEVEAELSAERWLTATEAVALGLADTVPAGTPG